MTIANADRQAILQRAIRWIGTPYADAHTDSSWRDPTRIPRTFDCSSFVCRVAMDALGIAPDLLVARAGWLADHLASVTSPEIGDVVCYERASIGLDRAWHVMLYAGNGMVIGACDATQAVIIRAIDYKPVRGHRWRLAAQPFRCLELS